MNAVALTRSARVSGDVGKLLVTVIFLLVLFSDTSVGQQSAINSKDPDPRTGQISGHIYSATTGAPLAKAVVTITQEIGGDQQPPSSVQTGADGSFVFTTLAAGKYGLSVERCGFVSHALEEDGAYSNDPDAAISLTASQKREGIEIHLLQGGVISGSVTDQDGEPVPELLVQAMSFPYQPGGTQTANSAPSPSAQTDDLGNFRVGGLNPGAYYVLVGADSPRHAATASIVYRDTAYPNAYLARDAQRVRVNAGSETSGIHITVHLEKSFAVRGRIHGACQPDSGVRCLMFAWPTGSFEGQNEVNTEYDSDGTFEVRGIFPGEYSVRAIAFRQSDDVNEQYFGVGNTRVQVFDRDAETDVSVRPLARVSGTVVDETLRTPELQNFQITLSETVGTEGDNFYRQIDADPDVKRSSLNAGGHFEVDVIGSGKYVFGLSGRSQEVSGIEVLDRGDSTPPLNADLMYVKEAVCSGRDYAKEPVTLSPGTRIGDCRIKIGHDTASINGRVMNGDKSVAGQIVIAITESMELRRNPRYTLTGRTNHDGQFRITGIIPGDYLIFAVTPNEEQSYYSLDFPDRNLSAAERTTFRPGETKIFVLNPSNAQ